MDIQTNDDTNLPSSSSVSERYICNCYSCIFVKNILIKKLVEKWEPNIYNHIRVEHISQCSRNIVHQVFLSLRCGEEQKHEQFIVKLPKMGQDSAGFENEDLTKYGYTQFRCKLDRTDLRICMEVLAKFHGTTFRLQNGNDYVSRALSYELSKNKEKRMNQRSKSVRNFLESISIIGLDCDLYEKIKLKLQKIERLETEIATTIIHGRFTRSKVFIKYADGGCYIQLIDFQSMTYDSPAIDFGRIFLTNLPDEYNVSSLEELFRSMLEAYLEKLKQEYPEVPSLLVEKDIIHNMILSYIYLNAQEIEAIENHKTILDMLNKISSLD
ncbi:uncharacterized protein LOC105286892 isoform X2 [Ooceraea biroi]|uniref:uncharacterized protein LOC105286892 isoform X2 n=1 Tax=Ooceraea biroi TaxID=2015173 RepID=UPI000F079658|nr:uncharacterized protein LOC105286892 isoform X2 [Ooceraea biroi]